MQDPDGEMIRNLLQSGKGKASSPMVVTQMSGPQPECANTNLRGECANPNLMGEYGMMSWREYDAIKNHPRNKMIADREREQGKDMRFLRYRNQKDPHRPPYAE